MPHLWRLGCCRFMNLAWPISIVLRCTDCLPCKTLLQAGQEPSARKLSEILGNLAPACPTISEAIHSQLKSKQELQLLTACCCHTMAVEVSFTSVGCNRVVNALDWGHDGCIAYGGHNLVAIYDPKVSISSSSGWSARYSILCSVIVPPMGSTMSMMCCRPPRSYAR